MFDELSERAKDEGFLVVREILTLFNAMLL